jgi:ribosomal protein S18 acetylase RimI-like enzyme
VTDGPIAGPCVPPDIVLARVSELSDELMEAVRRLYPQLTNRPVPDEQAIARVLDAGASVMVAYSDWVIVGMATLIITSALSGTTAHVEDVVVDAGFRGRGIAELMMRGLINGAQKAGADQMTLTSHPTRESANRLYQRLGFQLGGTNYYSLEIDPPEQAAEKRPHIEFDIPIWEAEAVALYNWLWTIDLDAVPISHKAERQAFMDLLSRLDESMAAHISLADAEQRPRAEIGFSIWEADAIVLREWLAALDLDAVPTGHETHRDALVELLSRLNQTSAAHASRAQIDDARERVARDMPY